MVFVINHAIPKSRTSIRASLAIFRGMKTRGMKVMGETDPASLKRPRHGEHELIRLIRDRGSLSRSEAVRQLNISLPTVAKVANSLLRARLLEEFDATATAVGRPAKRLRMARETAQLLGIVIAPGSCWVASAGLDGILRPERVRKMRTPGSYDDLIEALAGPAKELMQGSGMATLGAGICVPGLFDLRNNRSLFSATVPAIAGHAPSIDLADRLGVECVTLQSKQALCLAEGYFGEVRGLDDLVTLDLTTGVGMGVVSGGRLVIGKNGFAGEIGHVVVKPDGLACGCGNRGCLETIVSDLALAARISDRLGRRLDIEEVIGLARSGELRLGEEVDELIHYLSIALATVINSYNPSKLIIHGQIFDLEEGMLPRLVESTGRLALKAAFAECRIVRARGNKIQGAVAAALHHLIESLAW